MLIKKAGFSVNATAEEKAIQKIAELSKCFEIEAFATNGFDQAQVSAGGVYLSEIDECFQAKKCPGMYICGELLNVDGYCGGYNLQWAWSSGCIAGKSALRKLDLEKFNASYQPG